ncbi:MAG TPA: hypothetical protein VF498_10345, partial [Anaerolineales bacterium]
AVALEGVVGFFALLSLGVIFALRQAEPETPSVESEPLPEKKTEFNLPQVEETSENLDKTRFN